MKTFTIDLPRGSGKACRGCAKTISLQLNEDAGGGFVITRKLFRFTNGDMVSMRKAYAKAHAMKLKLEAEES